MLFLLLLLLLLLFLLLLLGCFLGSFILLLLVLAALLSSTFSLSARELVDQLIVKLDDEVCKSAVDLLSNRNENACLSTLELLLMLP